MKKEYEGILIDSKKPIFFSLHFSNYNSLFNHYATKNRKTMRKNISTKKILIISHLFDDILFRYLSNAPCAPSTFDRVSSMFSSILQKPTQINF